MSDKKTENVKGVAAYLPKTPRTERGTGDKVKRTLADLTDEYDSDCDETSYRVYVMCHTCELNNGLCPVSAHVRSNMHSHEPSLLCNLVLTEADTSWLLPK